VPRISKKKKESLRCDLPEGPEVRRCGELLGSLITGRHLLAIKTVSGKLHREGIAGIEMLEFPGYVSAVGVKGKRIAIYLNDVMIISSLGMSGWWYPPVDQLTEDQFYHQAYYNGKNLSAGDVINKATKHTRAELICATGRKALFVDTRNFGNMVVVKQEVGQKQLNALGCDPLSFSTSEEEMIYQLRQWPNHHIGEVLLNQAAICGIGNIYRAESLYLARISPIKKVSSLADEELSRLSFAIRYVLYNAYKNHGTMSYPSSFIGQNADIAEICRKIAEGKLTTESHVVGFLAYGQKHDPLGNQVVKDVIGGRTMWWVPEVQR
jgi:formamidopyrimidine-DNA glycosylase